MSSRKSISPRKRLRVWNKTGGLCWYCGVKLRDDFDWAFGKTPKDAFTVEHLNPKSQGGGHGDDNLVPACMLCNCGRRDRDLERFRNALLRRLFPDVYVEPFTERQLAFMERLGLDRQKVNAALPRLRFWFEQNQNGK